MMDVARSYISFVKCVTAILMGYDNIIHVTILIYSSYIKAQNKIIFKNHNNLKIITIYHNY